jgi:nicotinamidase-related amidase
MYALIVIDAQNEFSRDGKRPVPNFYTAVKRISERVGQARRENCPIAWIRHFNKPTESKAFVPGTWGAEFYAGLGPKRERNSEKEFHKDIYGAFAGTDVGIWLESQQIKAVLIVGFYTHACVSTSAREALMMDLEVSIDYSGTGACDMTHELLGNFTADEVRNSALLQLENMGAKILIADFEIHAP